MVHGVVILLVLENVEAWRSILRACANPLKEEHRLQNLSAAHVFRDAAKKCRFTHLTGVIFLLWRVGFLACAHCNLILH